MNKPCLYILQPDTVPHGTEIMALARNTFDVFPLDRMEALTKAPQPRGVVVCSSNAKQLPGIVTSIRTLAPLCGCVVVLDRQDTAMLEGISAVIDHADLLLMPTAPVEVQARLLAALQLSELRHVIHESAQIDEATGMVTPPYFMKRLGEEMSLAKRHGSPVTTVILGIASLEAYQDSYGFAFVVNMLNQVAQTLHQLIRQEDLVARLSDSEIGILLPRSTEKGSLTLTKRILQEVEALPFYMGDQEEHLHLKAGVACYPSEDDLEMDPDTLIRYTRHALHHARCSKSMPIQLFSDMRPFVG